MKCSGEVDSSCQLISGPAIAIQNSSFIASSVGRIVNLTATTLVNSLRDISKKNLTKYGGSRPTCANTGCSVSDLKNSHVRKTTYTFVEVLDPHVGDNPVFSVSGLAKESESHLLSDKSCEGWVWVSLEPNEETDLTNLDRHLSRQHNRF